MAVKDFQKYLTNVQAQVLAMRNDITDFEEALKAGYITEDKLTEVKEEALKMDINYQRLLYVAYLLELPQRKKKQERYRQANKKLETYFTNTKADAVSVASENESALTELRKQLKKLNQDK